MKIKKDCPTCDAVNYGACISLHGRPLKYTHQTRQIKEARGQRPLQPIAGPTIIWD